MSLNRQMTLLGLIALIYYGTLVSVGVLSTDVMPQFLATAIIFLSSGRLARMARKSSRVKSNDQGNEEQKKEPDWALRTQILNWTMTLVIVAALALWVMKPVGVPFLEFIQMKFFLGFVDHEASWNFISEIPPP